MSMLNGFKAGFGGCFGVSAAMVIGAIGLSVCSSQSRQQGEYLPPIIEAPPLRPQVGGWRVGSERGGATFEALSESGLELSISCRNGAVFALGIENASRFDATAEAAITIVIDGRRETLRIEGADAGHTIVLLSDFTDSARQNAIGRAILSAREVSFEPARGMGTFATTWGPFEPAQIESAVASACR